MQTMAPVAATDCRDLDDSVPDDNAPCTVESHDAATLVQRKSCGAKTFGFYRAHSSCRKSIQIRRPWRQADDVDAFPHEETSKFIRIFRVASVESIYS